jgi:hypothetical protein
MLWADFLQQAGDALSNPVILIPMILIFLGLIGVMVFMRMKKRDDDE